MQSPEQVPNIFTQFPPPPSSTDHKDTSNNNNNNNNTIKNIKNLHSTMTLSNNNSSLCQSDGVVDKDMDMKKSSDKSDSGINTSTSSSSGNDNSSPSKDEEKILSEEDEEEMDEPDAMLSADKQPNIKNTKSSSTNNSGGSMFQNKSNGYADSAEEDMDEDDRLVIDDQEVAARGLSKSTPNSVMNNQVFNCPECHVVTTSPQAYLYHLDQVHNGKEFGKKPLTSAEDYEAEEGEIPMSNKTMDSESAYMNLSIPRLHNGSMTASPKDYEDGEESSLNITPAFMSSKAMGSSMPLGITTENIDQMFDDDKKKKKKTRQEVDPGKYFEAVDSGGTKYACSQCGNIYKWRKSLNKHWKEKHLNDPLAEVCSPPGMMELLKSGKYTQLGSRRIYDNIFLQTIKAQKDDDISRTSTPSSEIIKASTPTNFMDSSFHQLNTSDTSLASPMPTTLQPKMIGPFVANTAQPMFPGLGYMLQHMAMQNGYDAASNEAAVDLTQAAKRAMAAAAAYPNFLTARSPAASTTPDLNSSFDQDQPLDFSKKTGDAENSSIKSEKMWEESSPSPSPMKTGTDSFLSKLHRCTKCDYSSISEVDFANHTSSHYSKRVCKCFECKMQLNSMEELNAHYVRDHSRKLTDYKEAVKKIPHGLQQTYHLLKMDLQSIGELNNQDLGSSESKSLKCKKCDFEAKWPAELQKHAVSHSEERPYICMVCGSTYKWKWDLVKHFQKSHPTLPNPYRRNDKRESPDVSSEDEMDDEPNMKRAKMSGSSSDIASGVSSPYHQDDMISVKGILAAAQTGQRFVSSQPNLDDEQQPPQSSIEQSFALMQTYPYAAAAAAAAVASGTPVNLAQEFMERHQKAQKAIHEAIKSRQQHVAAAAAALANSSSKSPGSGSGNSHHSTSQSTSPIPLPSSSSASSSSDSKTETLPYKCTMCNYHARWPSEVTQHMKNHSDCKPYLCPRCDYRSKWKWDVVKHLKRCGGGNINDVIDTTKLKMSNKDTSPNGNSNNNMVISGGPPNAIVSGQGKVKKTTPQPLSFIVPSVDANGHQSALVVRGASSSALESTPTSSSHSLITDGIHHANANHESALDSLRHAANHAFLNSSETIDLTTTSRNNNNNNDSNMADNNVNNNYASYSDGQPPALPPTNMLLSPSLAANNLSSSSTNDLHHLNNNNNNNHHSQNVSMASPNTPSSSSSTLPASNNNPTTPVAPNTTNTSTPTSSHRVNSSGEIWNCPHCPFSTQSQAELKRHSGLHMDDKPFKCNECHYSTRWACDLKKHRKSYDHYPKNTNNNNNNNNFITKNNDNSNKTLQKATSVEENKGRFKCFKCSVFFVTLQGLIDHRKNTHSPSEHSSTPQTVDTNEIDAARIKHPRKQIKQFSCPKCSFICKNRQTMDKHIEEHEQMERDAFQCFYCNSQYRDKEALLDHIVTHSSFNAKEWETFFMIPEEEEQTSGEVENAAKDQTSVPDVNESKHVSMKNTTTSASKEDQTKMDSEAATQARIQQILDEIPKQKNTQQQMQPQPQQGAVGFNKFKCEWCPAEFINLTAVYKHASVAHPIQLKEQDVSMSMAYASLHASRNQDDQQQTNKMDNNAPTGDAALQILKQQIAEKRNHQLVEKINHMVSSNPKLQEVLNKRLEEETNGGKRFQCDKCTFSTSSQSAFQNHYELHGTKFQSQCWFCEYSVNNMEILYQHMKISHTRKWKQLSQDPRYANQIQRMNLAFSKPANSLCSPPLSGEENNRDSSTSFQGNSSSSDVSAMDLSSKKSPSDLGHDIVYIQKPQYTWSDIPVNVVPDGTVLNFVCPKCSFKDASISKTCAHVIQSHRAMSKFNCTRCQFSDDNIHVMSDHCKTCHPVNERIVEVLDFKQINFTELQMVQLSAMKEKASLDLSKGIIMPETKPSQTAPLENSDLVKALSCPFCPFKTDAKATMKNHIENHSQVSRYRCQNCDFSSDLPNIMTEHMKVHGENYNEDPNLSPSSSNAKNVKEEPEQHSKMSESLEQNDKMDRSLTCPTNEVVKTPSPKAKTPGRIRYRCSICPYHTTCKSNIFKHKRQHIIPKRYKCTKCSYTAARAVLLRKHIESHSVPITDEDGYYHDIFYNPHSPSGEKIEDNEEAGDNEEVEAGDVSEEDSTTSDDLENEINSKAIADLEAKYILEAEAAHKASSTAMDESESTTEHSSDKHHPLRKQKCPHCPFSSNSVYEFQKHLNFHGTQERYRCDLCSYSIDRFNLLTQHRKLHANDPGYSPNPQPSVLLNTSFILQQNEMAATASSTVEEEEKEDLNSETSSKFHCALCSYKAANKKTFDIHSQSHGQRKRFVCDFCDWSADAIPPLHQHRKVHENEPNYQSSRVDSIFLNQEYDDGASGEFEAKFMEEKDGDKPKDSLHPAPFKLTVVKKSYPCKLCPYKTNSKNNYHIHKSMHSSDGEFSCTKCSFSAISRGLLQQHTLLHSSSSPKSPTSYKGSDNSNGSTLSSSLANCDTTEMTCQRCPFTATSLADLTQHMKCHGGLDKLVSCPYCDFKSATAQDMYTHIQIHFPGTKLDVEAMAKMLEEHSGKDNDDNLNNNNNNNNNNNESSLDLSSKPSGKSMAKSPSSESQVIKTKIYVCQYCEREFEAKSLMIQHEKQHLVGSH